ncbi:MAG: CD225/dispanin family protein [Tannerella sp.]|jgi:hypothetical protein|nr:CD225/dispanin family protein [Tannerella sp.]
MNNILIPEEHITEKETSGGYRPPVALSYYPVPAILSMLFYSLLGVVSIVYTTKVNSLYVAGNYWEVNRISTNTKRWVIGSMIVMIIRCL